MGATSSGAASVGSSRSLLITVLGELVLPAGGGAWTQSLATALAAVGVRDKAARQAISRMQQRGWLEPERVGRKTRWHLTESAIDLLGQGAERIYGFGSASPQWDQRWLLVMATVPERQRNDRYRLTSGLTWAGFGSLGQGVWLSPWLEREVEASRVVEELGVDGAVSFRAESGELGSPMELAARAWNLPALRKHYEAFLADLPAVPAGLQSPGAAVRELVLLVHRWRQFPFLDPDLPPAVLPADWPASMAAEAFAARRAAWGPAASRWWRETERTFEAS